MTIPQDLTAPISFFGTFYDVLRKGSGSYASNGEWVPNVGGNVTVNIILTVQPTAGEDQRKLAEAGRTEGGITIYSPSELKKGDIIPWNNKLWEIVVLIDRQHDGSYHKGLCGLYVERVTNTP